jgi:ABC-type bacteriocin/lantibiotic exporter with double-glycine peptidase domain
MNLDSAGLREAWADAVLSDAKQSANSLDPMNGQSLSGEVVASLQSITCGYHRQPIFRDVTLTFHAGQLAGLVGPTGSGKTTLLKLCSGWCVHGRGQCACLGLR